MRISSPGLAFEIAPSIDPQGEFEASTKLREAAKAISGYPQALQLRFLQTMTEVAAENNSTIVFPLPIDLFKHFLQEDPKKRQ